MGIPRRAGVRWVVDTALEVYHHTLKWSAMLSDAIEVFKGGRGRTELVRQGILASSRYPAKGIRRRSLFKVDSAGKRRLLHCCHRSDMD